MIKNLLEQNASRPDRNDPENKDIQGESELQTAFAPQYVEVNEAEELPERAFNFELSPGSAVSDAPEKPTFVDDLAEPPSAASVETRHLTEPHYKQPVETAGAANDDTTQFSEAYSDLSPVVVDEPRETVNDFKSTAAAETAVPNFSFPSDDIDRETKADGANAVFQKPFETPSFAETARQSGLAYAAAVTLFASVIFMLIIGWFADLLFGSSPWGKVGGIVVGSLIGFIQLFRITSQIFKNND